MAPQEEELQKKKIVSISISNRREKLHTSGIKYHRRMNWQMYQDRTVNSTELFTVHQNRVSKRTPNPQGCYSNQNTHTHTQIHCILLLFNNLQNSYIANGKEKQYKRASSVRDPKFPQLSTNIIAVNNQLPFGAPCFLLRSFYTQMTTAQHERYMLCLKLSYASYPNQHFLNILLYHPI